MQVFTIGHASRPLEELVATLHNHGVERLVDVRSLPRSRRNPQYDADTLPQALAPAGIGYLHMAGLGGYRRPVDPSPNDGWEEEGFRGFADYMQTAEFERHLAALTTLADEVQVAMLCAEAAPSRCHRSLIADALTVRGIAVAHIVEPRRSEAHRLTAWAQVDGERITYPYSLRP